jgi:uncharacterized lipoprotein YddW (UPF0748 family)
MNSRITIILLILIGASLTIKAQSQQHPQQEFRGVWIATVANLDWPASRTATPASQQADLRAKFDRLKGMGINAVFFQIRTENDALYNSPYEPWSYYLTGEEGRAPNPMWDPLQFAIELAQERGMELHAWFNPYRSVRNTTLFTRSPEHISVTKPDWILTFGTLKILNPGIPDVIDYTVKIVMDVVRRYDVDGVHFDDYFYPYSPNNITNQDAATYAEFRGDFNNIADWRRDNVNRMIQAVHDSIKTVKPHVKFGISPFGIWRPGHPQGIVGTDAYATLYADAKAWIANETVDYLIPQLYWAFGGGQDYAKLAPWWATETKNRHMYTGNAVYKMEGSWNWPTREIGNQVRFNREGDNIRGQTYFRSRLLHNNLKGIADSMRTDWHRYPVLTPTMEWLDTSIPPGPGSPEVVLTQETGGQQRKMAQLSWIKPEYERVGADTLLRYVIYRVNAAELPDAATVMANPANLVGITGQTSFTDFVEESSDPYFYFVTSVTRNSVQSDNPIGLELSVPTSVESISQNPSKVALLGNYPNPFNPGTSIRFSLPESMYAKLTVYDVTGRQLAVLSDGNLAGGHHQIRFDGSTLGSGVYMYILDAGGTRFSGKMTLMK